MSFGGHIDSDAFKKYLNKMAQGCRCDGCRTKTGPIKPSHSNPVGANGPSGSSCKTCGCDSDSEDCGEMKKCTSTTEEKQDGCFCRKCNDFLPMVEPDDKKDGKTLCYNCAHPWG